MMSKERKCMIIPVQLCRSDGAWHSTNALIDSGAEVNIVSPILAKQLAWEPLDRTTKTVLGFDGHATTSHGSYEQNTKVVDSWHQSQTKILTFHAVDSDEYDVILGYPWLEAVDPQISFKQKQWRIPSVRQNSEEHESEYHAGSRSRSDGGTQNWRTLDVRYNPEEHELESYAVLQAQSGSRSEVGVLPARGWRDASDAPELQWRYRIEKERFILQKADRFLKDTAREAAQVYSVCVSDVYDGETPSRHQESASIIESHGALPGWLSEEADVFDAEKASILPPHNRYDHAIDLDGGEPPYGPLYNLSVSELKALREYLDDAQAKGWIRPSVSAAGAPILFVPKKDGSLRLCVDYRGLNRVTKKNRYPLPLISETLDRLVGAKVFTKLDLKDAYHRLRIKRGDEWKTAFRTRYGHFEYLVMPFGLANAPATFQAYINHAMQGLLDVVCVVYLDDILIFSQNQDEHRSHVKQVLKKLRKFGLYANLKKCEFETDTVEFLGFIVSTEGVKMDERRVQTIKEWPIPTTIRELQVFLGFANFYRRFIERYSKIAAPMTSLLRGGKQNLDWGGKEQEAFQTLKNAFLAAPLLQHFDPTLPVFVETDASGFAIAGVLSQPFPSDDGTNAHRKPVAYWSRKLAPAEANYETHDAELLAIVAAFKQWRHYLEGSAHTVTVLTDHNNLQYFMTTKELNSRQARWAEKLARFDFVIQHRPGKSNPADAPSRRPDYEMSEVERASIALPTLKNLLSKQDPAVTNAVRQKSEGSANILEEEELASAKPVLLQRLQRVLNLAVEPKRSSGRAPPIDIGWSANLNVRTVTQKSTDAGKSPGGARECRQLSPGEMPVLMNLNDHSIADAEQSGRLKPSAGANYCSDCVPRSVIVAAMGTRTAYDVSNKTMHELILECQRRDAFVDSKIQALSSLSKTKVAGSTKGWRVDAAGLLRKHDKIYVPGASALREEILQRCHDDPLAGHFGIERTALLVKRSYIWPTLMRDVQDYIATCNVCQRTKVKRHRPYGELSSLPIPKRPWQEITMDFITGLPASRRGDGVYDSVLVVVDRFTKMARYLPCRKTIDAEELAELFIGSIVKDFGLPSGIVSDRGSVFTSKFWSTLCWILRIKRKLSTAFHPQTDGQTERQNQTLEQYLRQYCSFHQDDWASLLNHAEFAYNNSDHASLGASPFFALYGYHPRTDIDVEDNVPGGEVPTATERAKQVGEIREELAQQLRKAVEYQAVWYNKKHVPMHFAVGQWVMLSVKNIPQARPSRKLSDRFLGPFEVEEPVGHQAYKLKLPQTMRIHPVFHVSLLEPYRLRDGEDPSQHDPPVLVNEDEEYEVEEILSDRKLRGQIQYLVRWKGWSPAYNQWIPALDIHAPDLVREYTQAERRRRNDSVTQAHPKRRRKG
jgi:transposase InsO family protein